MKIIAIKNVRKLTGNVKEIIMPNNSPFVVTVFDHNIAINRGDEVLAQKHIHMNLDDREKETKVALDSAYRSVAMRLMLNAPFEVDSLYRHIARTLEEEVVMTTGHKDAFARIMKLTRDANDVPMTAIGETDFNDSTEAEFDIVIRHDGDVFTATGTEFQIEMISELTGLPILGR